MCGLPDHKEAAPTPKPAKSTGAKKRTHEQMEATGQMLNAQVLKRSRGDRWDDWVSGERIRKNSEENRELQQSLKREFDSQNRKPAPIKSTASSRKKPLGSDLSSGRGSEDRHSSVPAGGRGTKRGRDNEIEKVSVSG